MDAQDTRYVRIQGDTRATRFGYSLWSVEAYAVDRGASRRAVPKKRGTVDGGAAKLRPGRGAHPGPRTEEART